MRAKVTNGKRFTGQLRGALRRAESGQAIVLLALVMVALLGILGLAIDGGRLFYLHRDTQNAVDAAVVAATYALCSGGDPILAGRTAAAQNGYVHNGTSVIVAVNSPPLGPIDSSHDPSSFAEVTIQAEIDPYFIQLVFGGELEVTTYGLGHCLPGWDPFVDGRTVVGTSTTCPDAVSLTGSHVTLTGGVTSNTDIKSQGSTHIVNGPVSHVGGLEANNLVINPSTGDVQLTEPVNVPLLYDIRDYAPGGVRAMEAQALGMYHQYTGDTDFNMNQINNTDPEFLQGLFYVDGDLTIRGNTVLSGPQGVTIVATGEIKLSGSNHVLAPYMDGLTIFTTVHSDCDSTKAIDASSSGTTWFGVIYAPYGHVKLPGSGVFTARGAIIADTVSVPGSSTDITYDPTYLPDFPPSIEISE